MPRYYKERLYHPSQRKAVGAHQRAILLQNIAKEESENPNYVWDTLQADIASFTKQNSQSSKRDKL